MNISSLLCCGHCVLAFCDLSSIALVSLVKRDILGGSVLFSDVARFKTHNFNGSNTGLSLAGKSVTL